MIYPGPLFVITLSRLKLLVQRHKIEAVGHDGERGPVLYDETPDVFLTSDRIVAWCPIE